METTKKPTEKITVEYSHDTREGWACKAWYVDDILVASTDGTDMTYHSGTKEQKETVKEYIEENGVGEPDWKAYEEALTADQAAQIRNDHPDDYVLITNNYESETSPGFANTYQIVSAVEGDISACGWQTAKKISEIGEEFDAELVNWAREENLDTIINWF